VSIPFESNYDIMFERTRDNANDNPLDFTNDGSTCSFKVYNADADSFVAVAVSTGTTCVVSDATKFTLGDTLELKNESKVMFDCGAITDVDTDTNILTFTNTLIAVHPVGAQARVRLGDEIAMVEYGTAERGSAEYGFIGVLPWNHPGLVIGMNIEIRKIFIGAPPSGLVAIGSLCGVVGSNCIDV